MIWIEKYQSITNWKTLAIFEFNQFSNQSTLLLEIAWPKFSCENKLLWKGNALCTFYVRSNFLLNFFDGEGGGHLSIWSRLSKLKLHERLKMFLWRLMAEVIPFLFYFSFFSWINDLVMDKIWSGEWRCAICGSEVESYFHRFKEWHGVHVLAFASN